MRKRIIHATLAGCSSPSRKVETFERKSESGIERFKVKFDNFNGIVVKAPKELTFEETEAIEAAKVTAWRKRKNELAKEVRKAEADLVFKKTLLPEKKRAKKVSFAWGLKVSTISKLSGNHR